MDAAIQAIEPQFLSQALDRSIPLRIGQMNKTELEGVVREIGRYEINVEDRHGIITILKKDISYLSAPSDLVHAATPAPAESPTPPETLPAKPNVQQEFLDKAIRERLTLTIFLLTGQRIRSAIEAYDNFTLLIREGGRQQLIYKHAVTTINR